MKYNKGERGKILKNDVVYIFLVKDFLEEGEPIFISHHGEQSHLHTDIAPIHNQKVDFDGAVLLWAMGMGGLSDGGNTL